jgi:hypothetical protein
MTLFFLLLLLVSAFGPSLTLGLDQIPIRLMSESAHSCGAPTDIFQFGSLDLTPDPPKKAASLSFTIRGTLTEEVVKGATVHVNVKLGFIGLYNEDLDLCDQIKNVQRECPLPRGPFELSHTVDIPWEAPSVRFSFSFCNPATPCSFFIGTALSGSL